MSQAQIANLRQRGVMELDNLAGELFQRFTDQKEVRAPLEVEPGLIMKIKS